MSDTQTPPPPNPADRQVLAGLGNRYAVFGSGSTLRGVPRLGPADVTKRFPRIDDERENVEARIVQSLVVEGFAVRIVENRDFGDVELVAPDGRTTLVEIKVGDRDFAGIDLGRAWKELDQTDEHREIWGFNLERLSLGMVWSGRRFGTGFTQLSPLDVWEFNQDGSVFDRSKVVADVNAWSQRVAALYDDVEAWAREEGLTALRDRTIPLSEELMQKYAVPDRDMPILDLLDGEKPIVSMKPDGLWLVGFNGLIDVITRHGTFWLGGVPRVPGTPVWTLVDPRDRSRREWGRDAFMSVLGLVSAGE